MSQLARILLVVLLVFAGVVSISTWSSTVGPVAAGPVEVENGEAGEPPARPMDAGVQAGRGVETAPEHRRDLADPSGDQREKLRLELETFERQFRGHSVLSPEDLDAAATARVFRNPKGVILDPAEAAGVKVQAQLRLRSIPDAFSTEMARIMIRIGAADADPRLRGRVWDNFDNDSPLPMLVDPLLTALRQDPVAGVRAEAAGTLGIYVENPAVVLALQRAAQHDSAQSVRATAARTLEDSQRAVRK